MTDTSAPRASFWTRLRAWLADESVFFARPAAIVRGYDRANLRPDLVAGLTVAVVLLPQAIAYAMIAELPPQMGLYTAVTAAVAGTVLRRKWLTWGGSWGICARRARNQTSS